MSSVVPRPSVSKIIHDKSNEEEPKKKSREDWRKAKELEEARKAGTAPAAVDEEGRDINPHIPQYIASAPWYYGASGPTLKHQRPQNEEEETTVKDTVIHKKGVDTSKTITKFRKGACENCGAMTHKRKDCLERPRKVMAKYAEVIVAHDEYIQDSSHGDYDGKRDRWNGYDPANHKDIVEEFEKVEEAKRQLKAEKLKDNPNAEISDEEGDDDKYVDEVDMPGTKVDSKQRITVRNLRIREDTAKYLRNLDLNSAYYDPKTRSMRDNPHPQSKSEESDFAGENFVRFTGDTQKHAKAQLFAWEAYEKGVDVHLLAEPTKLELLQQEYVKKKDQFKSATKDTILGKYGGEEHLDAPPKALLLAQSEEYVEYSRSGKVIKGQEKQKAKSIYEEDVYINNHTAVWGSYWSGGKWGYKCCYSFIKNSYCVGDKNVAVPSVLSSNSEECPGPSNEPSCSKTPTIVSDEAPESESDKESDDEKEEEKERKSHKKSKKKKNKKKKSRKEKSRDKEDDKLKLALRAQEEHETTVKELMKLDERKRPFNSMYECKAPTEEELEAYMIKRKRDEDPMLAFLEK